MAAFLVVATCSAVWGVSQIGSNTNLGLGGTPTPQGHRQGDRPGRDRHPERTRTTRAATTFAILSATGFDPEGDGAERNGEAPRVFDGKDNTFWSSEGYASPNLGGLKKGVGLRLDLGQNRNVSTVKLVLPNASDVSVYVGEDRDSMDSATQIGASKGKSGDRHADRPRGGQGPVRLRLVHQP